MPDQIMAPSHSEPAVEASRGHLLRSWREVALYVKRGVRTVQRWEKQFQLPVHRAVIRGEVFAFSAELDAWFLTFARNPSLPGDGKSQTWREVAEQASREKDPERLMRLIDELNRLLVIDEAKSEPKPGHPTPGPFNTAA